MDAGFFDMKDYLAGGWVTGLKYESEVIDNLKERTGDKDNPLKVVRPLVLSPFCKPVNVDLHHTAHQQVKCHFRPWTVL